MKCSELQWFDVDDLPKDMIPIRRQALGYCLETNFYSEIIIDKLI